MPVRPAALIRAAKVPEMWRSRVILPVQGVVAGDPNAQLAGFVAIAFGAANRGRWEVSSRLRMLRSHRQVSTAGSSSLGFQQCPSSSCPDLAFDGDRYREAALDAEFQHLEDVLKRWRTGSAPP